MASSRRKTRYRDKSSLGKEPGGKPKGYDWRSRHDRRRAKANRSNRSAGLAFASLGGWLWVGNDGHHWKIVFPGGLVVEWWPASAKLVVNQNWPNGVHCHTWQKLWRYVKEKLDGTTDTR